MCICICMCMYVCVYICMAALIRANWDVLMYSMTHSCICLYYFLHHLLRGAHPRELGRIYVFNDVFTYLFVLLSSSSSRRRSSARTGTLFWPRARGYGRRRMRPWQHSARTRRKARTRLWGLIVWRPMRRRWREHGAGVCVCVCVCV